MKIGDDSLIPGFFVGGFECSSHRLRSGRRLDVSESTRHVEFAEADYARMAEHGIRVARDGIVWHRIEPLPKWRDFTSVLPMIRAARRHGIRVIWDLLHFGWPDDLDVFAPPFVDRFAALARDFALLLIEEGDPAPWICPVNEISFLSWGGGDVAALNPFEHDRGFEMKAQLVRATIAAIDAIRDVAPNARFVVHDPAFHVVPASDRQADVDAAERSRLLQFQACDMLTGAAWPQLGGRPDYIDVIGINYYPWNQWVYGTPLNPAEAVVRDDARYKPLHHILVEWHARYRKPIYIGETGCEGDDRADWFRTACDEMVRARAAGADVHGLCLYPIVSFPGWDNDRHCQNGLWDYADDTGHRPIHQPLAAELAAQQRRFAPPLASAPPQGPRAIASYGKVATG
jgi:beta-glucosidase/6-phospho-beta-glucosidase/beta-galactosidase